jgi:hypothetical protein
MAAKHNETITLYHPEYGTWCLTRKQFNEQYGLSKQDTSDLVNRRGKIRQGWSLPKQDNWKSFYLSVSQEVWNIAEKIAYEKGWTVETVICDAAEKQLKYELAQILSEDIE